MIPALMIPDQFAVANARYDHPFACNLADTSSADNPADRTHIETAVSGAEPSVELAALWER